MEIERYSELDDTTHRELVNYLNENFPERWPEQDPKYYKEINPGKGCSVFIGRDGGQIVYSAVVQERFKVATIHLGPLSVGHSDRTQGMEAILQHYKTKGFGSLRLQLPNIEQESVSELLSSLSKWSPRQDTDPLDWATIVVDITREDEEILSSFRSSYRNLVRRSSRKGVQTRMMTFEDVAVFARIYDEMYVAKNISKDFSDSEMTFQSLFELMKDEDGGFGIIAEKDEKVIGGVITAFGGKRAHYKFGATLPDLKKVPALHRAIYDSMLEAKARGCTEYDMCGYNRYAEEGSALAGINLFKSGFGGELVEYPEIVSFTLNPLIDKAVKAAKKIRRKVRK